MELMLFLFEFVALIGAITDNMVETGELATNDQGELYNVTKFDWSEADPWEKGIIIGVPVDWLLCVVAGNIDRTVSQPWEQTGENPGEWKSVAKSSFICEPLPSTIPIPISRYLSHRLQRKIYHSGGRVNR